MSVPNIDVMLYPEGPSAVQRQLYYLELAPADVASQPVCPLPLQVWVNNKEGSPIHLDSRIIARTLEDCRRDDLPLCQKPPGRRF